MTDTDRLAALRKDAALQWNIAKSREDKAYHRGRMTAFEDAAAGVTLKPAAPAEGLPCGCCLDGDGSLWTCDVHTPAAPAEGPEALRAILETGIKDLGGTHRFDLARALDALVHLAQPAAPAEGPLTPEEAEGWRTYAKRQGERGKPVVVNPVEFLGLLDRMTAPSEGLHHHDVNGVALWFEGTGGKPVGGPADD